MPQALAQFVFGDKLLCCNTHPTCHVADYKICMEIRTQLRNVLSLHNLLSLNLLSTQIVYLDIFGAR